MPVYDESRFDPPAAVANVSVVDPDRAENIADVPMLIDSGADATLLPRSAIISLGIVATASGIR